MLSKSPSNIIAQFFVFVNLFAKSFFPILISAGASTPYILLLPHTFSNAFNCKLIKFSVEYAFVNLISIFLSFNFRIYRDYNALKAEILLPFSKGK